MKCLVLLGFSTTGKSQILREFEKKSDESVKLVDSDREISSREGVKHIYEIYLKHLDRDKNDTRPAIRIIQNLEEDFLRTRVLSDKPLLIAAGPFLTSRKQWPAFVERLKPVFFYLQKNPEHVLCGLLGRHYRDRQNPRIANDVGFGCWDQDVTMGLCNGKWVLAPWHEALVTVKQHMDGVVPSYERLASQTFTWEQRMADNNHDERVINAIRKELNL